MAVAGSSDVGKKHPELTQLSQQLHRNPFITRNLRVSITIAHLNTVGLTRPNFLVQCEEIRAPAADGPPSADATLAHLARLTSREQEVTRLACEGRTNQEIANETGLSVQMVKKHLHSIFRKLEVPSRSRLMALMR